TPPLVQLPMPFPSASESASAPVVLVVDPPPAPLLLEDDDAAPAGPAEFGENAVEERRPSSVALDPVPVSPPPVAAPETDSYRSSFPSILFVVGAPGTIGWLALLAFRVHRFRRALRHARPAPAELQAQVRDLAQRIGLRRCPPVSVVPGAVSPML